MRRDEIEIDNPCEVSWETMAGAGSQRHCAHCDEDVVNLSMMTESEAEAFLEANHSPCVRYHLSAEGDILFQTRLQRQRRGAQALMRTAAMLVPLALGGAAVATSVQSTEADAAVQRPDPVSEDAAAGPDDPSVVPDLVGLLSDGGDSLTEAFDGDRGTVDWFGSTAVGLVEDGASTLVDAATEPPEDETDPIEEAFAEDDPVMMGRFVPRD